VSEQPHGQATTACLSQVQVSRLIRARLGQLLVDDSSTSPGQAAQYILSDPRDLRCVRYIGQTLAPRRRLLQHLNAGRVWIPDELPWWVKNPELRPLYEWIRGLFRDGLRLPVMIITEWTTAPEARAIERQRILEALSQGQPLFNVEARGANQQMALPLAPRAFRA
jgi:hypothetical protein